MHLIQRLKAKYPLRDFQMDPVTAVITFHHEGFRIRDPFVTECGRFTCLPAMEYHIETKDAVEIVAHNKDLPNEFEE